MLRTAKSGAGSGLKAEIRAVTTSPQALRCLMSESIILPPLDKFLDVQEKEGPYNERLSKALQGAILLDKRTVSRSQATAIEICDVVTKTKQLVHVKRGTSSSSLSHLFAQGVVSAELLHMDSDFRKKVAKLFSGTFVGSGAKRPSDFSWLHGKDFAPQECEVSTQS
jgi:uncharacterized protein (TIGR04141 family)